MTVALAIIAAFFGRLMPFGHPLGSNTNPSLAGELRTAMIFLKLAV
jgi:hypothetical protein